MTKLAIAFGAILLGSAMVRAADFEVECRLGSGDPKGSRAAGTLKLVEAATLILKSGEDATVIVGGQVKIGTEMVLVGREVEVTATTADSGAVKVCVAFKLHSVIGAAAQQVSTAREQTVATIQPGGSVRVMIGQDPTNRQWADLTIRKLK